MKKQTEENMNDIAREMLDKGYYGRGGGQVNSQMESEQYGSEDGSGNQQQPEMNRSQKRQHSPRGGESRRNKK